MLRYLVGGLAAAALFIAPGQAQAAEQCYGAGVGPAVQVIACVDVELGLSDTTIAPRVGVRCSSGAMTLCRTFELSGVALGTTGFVPNPAFPAPCVDTAAGEIRSAGGTIGTLYVNGTATALNIPPFFVGNPAGSC